MILCIVKVKRTKKKEHSYLITFRCLPIMLPWFPIMTAVFHRTSPWFTSLSRIGFTMTILNFWASSWRKRVDSPSIGSANSHHFFSRVQNAKGIIHASCVYNAALNIWIKDEECSNGIILKLTCKQRMLTPQAPAASIKGLTLSMSAFFWSRIEAVVGREMEFWMRPTRTIRGSLVDSFSAWKV